MLKSLSFILLMCLLSFNHKNHIPFFHNINNLKTDSLKQKKFVHRTKLKYWKPKVGRLNPNPSDDDCTFFNKYTINQRLSRYPFSNAAKVFAVSFRYMDRRRDILLNDSVRIYEDSIKSKLPDSLVKKNDLAVKYESGLHIKNAKLNYSSLIELKELSYQQIVGLTKIIYNTSIKKPNYYAKPGYSCYEPRNALVFFDKNGKVFDYLELCFDCMRYKSLSHKTNIGTYCNRKFDLLKQFFIDTGIQFGTIKKD